MLDTAVKQKAKKAKPGKEEICGWILAGVPLIGFAIFGLVPMLLALVMAFLHIQGLKLDAGTTWVGLSNFANVLSDPLFYKSLVNTLYFALSLPVSLILSLIVSVLLSKKLRGGKVFRLIFFLPYVCSLVAVTFMWQWIFDTNYGVLNSIVEACGGTRVDWLQNQATLMPCMIVMAVWSGMGFNIILFEAALTNVSSSYYEAAEIDGAGAWQKFRYVTLPAISPTTFYLLTMGLIGVLQEFTRFQVMTKDGSPNNAGLTVVFYLYNYIYGGNTSGGGSYSIDMGKASTMALLLSVIIIGITVLNFKLSKRWVSYD